MTQAQEPSPTGIILYDKPAGVSSHDVVAQVRRKFGRSVKVGHAGTLDPFATGLLIILLGRATRTQSFFMGLRKVYRTVAHFGVTSDTGDPTGQLTVTGKVPQELNLPVGQIKQRPPAYSAVKIDGERAYLKARRGEEVITREREVTIFRSDLLWRDGDRAEIELECSSGTYVRTYVSELGDAYCAELRRTAIGPFSVQAADPERVIALPKALSLLLPRVDVTEAVARAIGFGQRVSIEQAPEGYFCVFCDQELVAVARQDAEYLKTAIVFS